LLCTLWIRLRWHVRDWTALTIFLKDFFKEAQSLYSLFMLKKKSTFYRIVSEL
jgi:hypothetical protein